MDAIKIDMFLGQSEAKGQIEGELSLPDEKTDIEKIFHVGCNLNVREKEIASDSIKVEGDAEFILYYIDTDEELQCFSANAPFFMDIEAKGIENDNRIDLAWRIEEASADIIDKRTAKVGATAAFSAGVSKSGSTLDLDESSFQTKRAAQAAVCVEETVFHPFHITEEVRIPVGMDNAEDIIAASGYGIINGIKKEGGNAVCYGEICLNTLYSSENGVWQMEESIPFEETVEVESSLDGRNMFGSVWVKKVTAAAYDKDTISYGISAVISLNITSEMTQGPVIDAYSLTHDIETVKNHISIKSPLGADTVKYTMRSTVPTLGGARPVSIMATPYITGEYAMDGTVNMEGNMCFDILYAKDEGGLDCRHIELPIDETVPAPTIKEEYEIYLEPNVQKATAVVMGDETEIRTAMDIVIRFFKQDELDVIESVSEKEPLKKDGSSILIYFKDEDEDLFDIAKANHVAMGDINTENGNKLILINPA